MNTLRGALIAFAGLVTACQSQGAPSAVGFVKPTAPLAAIDLAKPQVRIQNVELSGARVNDDGANRMAVSYLDVSLNEALTDAGFLVSQKPLPPESLALSRHVLRSVDPGRADRAHLPLLSEWAIDVPRAAERAAPPILIVFAEARINTAAHRLTQGALGIALFAPEPITGGNRRTHAGLFSGDTGELLWAAHMSEGDVQTPVGAALVADSIVARLQADLR
ncbi:MAG: hypothetical protein AAF216_06505 [Pseudomonadota bacterium]